MNSLLFGHKTQSGYHEEMNANEFFLIIYIIILRLNLFFFVLMFKNTKIICTEEVKIKRIKNRNAKVQKSYHLRTVKKWLKMKNITL